MKKLTLLLAIILIATSCDDGDIIVTEFDFDDTALSCSEFEYVFYNINDTNETLTIQFETTEPIFTPRETTYEFPLNGEYSYRRFNDAVPTDYFCTAIPPATPIVEEEFTSTDGDVNILTTGVLSDDDNVPFAIEALNDDTDFDGLPDTRDDDDDGDNVPTRLEGINLDDISLSRDTDLDTIPDYLDDDDDGDGILTRNEDANMDLNPNNDFSDPNFPTVPDYLNNQVTVETIVNSYREHEYFVTELTLGISIQNTNLINPVNQEELRDNTVQSLGTFSSGDISIPFTPPFN